MSERAAGRAAHDLGYERARELRETFYGKPVRRQIRFTFGWPLVMQHIGDSLAVAYESDKWRDRGDTVAYKHLATSRNRVLAVPGLLRDADDPDRPWPVIGPRVRLDSSRLPKYFAILGPFLEANLRLHVAGTDENPLFGDNEDDGVVQVTVRRGRLGAASFISSEDATARPFLFVFTKEDGVLLLIVGEELDIRPEGIVG